MKSLPLFILFLQILSLTPFGLSQSNHCDTVLDNEPRTFKVFHVTSPCLASKAKNTSWASWVKSVIQDDKARFLHLTSRMARKANAPLAWALDLIKSPTYVVRVKVGTPPQRFFMTVDTSFGASWLPCNGCVGCNSTLFAPEKSTTFKAITCDSPQCHQVENSTCTHNNMCTYNQTYGRYSFGAVLNRDTISLDQDPLPRHVFGCIQKSSGSARQVPPQGLLGLGRGPMSFLSQTHSLYKSTFSYCLSSHESSNFSGSLRLGPLTKPNKMHYTKLLTNPSRPSLYYVNLVGIKVGRKTLDIPTDVLAFNPTTGAGTVIDSGSVFTLLTSPAYKALRDEIIRRMGKAKVSYLGGFDTCYKEPIKVPSITFMFESMKMKLSQHNFLIKETSLNITCLAMAAFPDNANSTLNVIANYQQENHRVLFDIPNNRIGIARETCT